MIVSDFRSTSNLMGGYKRYKYTWKTTMYFMVHILSDVLLVDVQFSGYSYLQKEKLGWWLHGISTTHTACQSHLYVATGMT